MSALSEAAKAYPLGSLAKLPVDVGGNTLSVVVKVTDHRFAFGRLDLKVSPVCSLSGGAGWVSADRLSFSSTQQN